MPDRGSMHSGVASAGSPESTCIVCGCGAKGTRQKVSGEGGKRVCCMSLRGAGHRERQTCGRVGRGWGCCKEGLYKARGGLHLPANPLIY